MTTEPQHDDGAKVVAEAAARDRILVLDGDTRASLVVVRRLAAAGYTVGVVSSRRDALSNQSKYASELIVAPLPTEEPETYARILEERIAHGDVAAIFPCAEESIVAIDAHRRRLEKQVRIVLPPKKTLDLVRDDTAVARLAEKLDIPVPAQIDMVAYHPIARMPFPFPALVKPRQRYLTVGHGYARVDSRLVYNLDELVTHVRRLPDAVMPCLVQAILRGEYEEYAALYKNGKPLYEMGQRPTREMPPTGAASAPLEAIRADTRILEWSRRILGELKFNGCVLVKYKRLVPGGVPYLVNIRGFLWESVQLAVDAGVDFPVLAVKHALGENIAPQGFVRYGTRMRWVLGDLDHLFWYLTRGGVTRERVIEGAPSRLEAIARFFRDFDDPATRQEVQSDDDPLPYRVIRRRYIRRILGTTLRRVAFRHDGATEKFRGIILRLAPRGPIGDTPIKELIADLIERNHQFAVLVVPAPDHADAGEAARFFDLCSRESTEQCLLIPALTYTAHDGAQIAAIGSRTALARQSSVRLAAEIRAAGGVPVWANPSPRDLRRRPELVEEVAGVEVWNVGRDGPLAPDRDVLDAYVRALDRTPYLSAFQIFSLVDGKVPRGSIRIQATTLSESAVLGSFESGLFYLRGHLFRARSDRLSFLFYRLWARAARTLADRIAAPAGTPPAEARG
ncbi:hypothetical protein K8I61_10485 [bacterium]|nr:hypothetical protein [bacterium]